MKNRSIIFFVVVIIIAIIVLFIVKSNSAKTVTNDNLHDDRVKGASTQDEVLQEEKDGINKTISTEEAKALIAGNQGNKELAILDVRTQEEFFKGHIDGAQNLDFYDSFELKISKLNKNRTYLIYCQSGNRSNAAMSAFKQLGFKEVYELDGGYNVWQEKL